MDSIVRLRSPFSLIKKVCASTKLIQVGAQQALSEIMKYVPGVIRFRGSMTALFLTPLACGGSPSNHGEPGTLTYCDVKPILEASCERCHGETLHFGAPMPLTTYDQVYRFRASAASVIRSEYMPFLGSAIQPPVEPLTSTEEEDLLSWFADGAPDCE